MEAPAEVHLKTVVGVSFSEDSVSLLCEDVSTIDAELQVVAAALPDDDIEDVEEALCMKCLAESLKSNEQNNVFVRTTDKKGQHVTK